MGNLQTQAELDALFADNDTGDISPARLRDFVESCVPSAGAVHFTDSAATPIATVDTWTKAANASELLGDKRFDMPASNRLRYTGTKTARARVIATLSFSCAANNQVLAFAIFINGVIHDPSVIRTKLATGADVQAVTIMAYAELELDDYVEVFVFNDTSDADITVEHGHMHALAFLT